MKLNEALNQLNFINSKTLQKTKFLQESGVQRLIEKIYNYMDVSLIGTIEAQKQWNIQLENEIKRLEPFEVNFQGLKRRFDKYQELKNKTYDMEKEIFLFKYNLKDIIQCDNMDTEWYINEICKLISETDNNVFDCFLRKQLFGESK